MRFAFVAAVLSALYPDPRPGADPYTPLLPERAEKYDPEQYTQRLTENSSNGGPFVSVIEWVKISAMTNTDWHQSGGVRGLKGVETEKYRTGKASHRLGTVMVKNEFGYYQRATGIVRTYPDGTRFDDVLRYKGAVFEHRVREKTAGKWEGRVVYRDADARPPGYKPLTVTCASCHDKPGTGAYGADGLVPGGDTVFSDPLDWSLVPGSRR